MEPHNTGKSVKDTALAVFAVSEGNSDRPVRTLFLNRTEYGNRTDLDSGYFAAAAEQQQPAGPAEPEA